MVSRLLKKTHDRPHGFVFIRSVSIDIDMIHLLTGKCHYTHNAFRVYFLIINLECNSAVESTSGLNNMRNDMTDFILPTALDPLIDHSKSSLICLGIVKHPPGSSALIPDGSIR